MKSFSVTLDAILLATAVGAVRAYLPHALLSL
jgi:hypothetical protein